MRFLLDTNVISDFVRGDAHVQARLRSHDPTDIAISTISAMEIEYGLQLVPARRKSIAPVVDAIFASTALLAFSPEDARAAASVRATLRRRGLPIGAYDVLLAGCALARGLVLVTANVAEFARVASLSVESWRE
jgi:tRNA(fMet)-specific endonuclease VapC